MSREYNRTGIHGARGLAAIDARSIEGRLALNWQRAALKAKGGANCPDHLGVEIHLAAFDLYRLALLQSFIVNDINQRGTIVNRRKRELGNVHAQYDQIDARFLRRCEMLKLQEARPVSSNRIADLIAQRKQQAGGTA